MKMELSKRIKSNKFHSSFSNKKSMRCIEMLTLAVISDPENHHRSGQLGHIEGLWHIFPRRLAKY